MPNEPGVGPQNPVEAHSPMTHYERLGVEHHATKEELRHALTQHAAQWSKRVAMAASLEKRQEAEMALAEVQEARRILLDDTLRAAYDARLEERAALPTSAAQCPYCAEPLSAGASVCHWCGEAREGGAALPGGVPVPVVPLAAAAPVKVTGGFPVWQKAAVAMVLGLSMGVGFLAMRPKTPPFRYDFRQLMFDERERGMGTARQEGTWAIAATFPEWVEPDGRPTALQRRRQAEGYGMPEVWGHLKGSYVQAGHREDLFLFAFDDPTTAHPENWHKYYVAVFEEGRKVAGPIETGVIDGLIQNVRFPQSEFDHVLTRNHGMHQGFFGMGAAIARVDNERWTTVADLGMVGADDFGHYGDSRATLTAATVAHIPGSWPPRFRIDEYTTPMGVAAEKMTFRLARSHTVPDPTASPSPDM
jgi:hypothetical protein